MEIESIVISACITVFALGLLAVSLVSYRKYKNPKLLFVSLVFFVFFIKGILLSFGLFYEQMAVIDFNLYAGLFDLMILVLLFIATLKR
jgi:hypothetical protein